MKKLLLSTFLSAFVLIAFGQDTTTHSLTAYIYQDSLLWIEGDYNQNCPEAGTGLQGRQQVGFHSGANQWAATVAADSSAALTGRNDSSDRFRVLINPKQYYGVEMSNLDNVFFLFNDYVENPTAQWDNAMRDSLNGGFGGNEPCADMRVYMDEVSDMPNTSLNVSGCKDTTNALLQIDFNYGRNCPEAGTDLSLESELGFHSGANQWAAIVEWDSATAKTLVNNGLDTFSVVLSPMNYYGVPFDSLESIYFVANNGVNEPMNPWGSSGRADAVDPTMDCSDLAVYLEELPVCANALSTSVKDLSLDLNIRIAPNPFDQTTLISFDNQRNEAYAISIINMNGQTVRSYQVNGSELQLDRQELSAGMYFLNIRNEEGNAATKKLIIK